MNMCKNGINRKNTKRKINTVWGSRRIKDATRSLVSDKNHKIE